jgi:hypothetical protein
MSIPVKFGKTYMIALDSNVPFELITAIYSEKGLLINPTKTLNNVKVSGD